MFVDGGSKESDGTADRVAVPGSANRPKWKITKLKKRKIEIDNIKELLKKRVRLKPSL